jgi:hypothetical protein
VNGVLGGDPAYQHPSCSNCPTGKVSVSYSLTDGDGDGYYKAQSGSLCVMDGHQNLPRWSDGGVNYAASVASIFGLEPAECDADWGGIVSVDYGAVDRDGDGYYVAKPGRTCFMRKDLPAVKSGVTYAAAVPFGRLDRHVDPNADPNADPDRNPLVPIGSFTLVAPSEQSSGAFNGVENLYYDYFDPGLGFHYFNTIRQESLWNPEFMVHGVRVVSAVGGSGEFGYWIQSFTEAYEAGSPELAQVDGAGRVVISCGVAPGTLFELRVRDSRTGMQQGHRFRSAGDGPACAPDPNPTPTPQLCLDPGATNYWMEGECQYPTPTPTEKRDPDSEPTPTPTEEDPCGENAFKEMSEEERESWRASEMEAAKSQAIGKNFGNLVFLKERIKEPKNSGPLSVLPHRYGHCLTYRFATEESSGSGKVITIHRTRYTTYDNSPKGTDNNGAGGLWRRANYSHATNYGSGSIDDPLSVAVSPELGLKYGDLLFDSEFGWLRVESHTSAGLDPSNRVDYWLGKPDPAPPHWKTQWEESAQWESYESGGVKHQFTRDVTLMHFPGGIVSKGFVQENPGRKIALPGSAGNLIGK